MGLVIHMMTSEQLRDIAHRVLSMGGAAARITGLLEDRRWAIDTGNSTAAESIDRTIDDLCGFRLDGRWIGAAEIDHAFRFCGWSAALERTDADRREDAEEHDRRREVRVVSDADRR